MLLYGDAFRPVRSVGRMVVAVLPLQSPYQMT